MTEKLSVPKANFADYFEFQGGKPQISQGEDGLWKIRHHYRKDSPEVTTHISPEERGQVILDTTRGPRLFDVASLWDFEGKPCETVSARAGGASYPRNTSSESKE